MSETTGERRNEPKQVKFRVTEEEFERLSLMADNVGMTVPAFVKAKAQGTRVRQPKINREGALAIAKELRAVGTNVNQIAKWCNSRDIENLSEEQVERLILNLEEIKKGFATAWQQLS
ncbi:plasmid mobilization protein [Priestia aryabhattai]|uniref:Plasmid mobilization relaxosome protein MobC n=1 Tax=Priestia aryabhattai TaxID=412384 RepID=A0ABD5KZN7_PRIAR